MWKRSNAKSIMKLTMNVQTIMSDLLSYPRAYRILFSRDSVPVLFLFHWYNILVEMSKSAKECHSSRGACEPKLLNRNLTIACSGSKR